MVGALAAQFGLLGVIVSRKEVVEVLRSVGILKIIEDVDGPGAARAHVSENESQRDTGSVRIVGITLVKGAALPYQWRTILPSLSRSAGNQNDNVVGRRGPATD